MSATIKPTKITFKKCEAEWYNYHNTLKEIVKLREEIMNPFQEENINVGGSKTNIPDKPTERIATRLAINKKLDYLSEVVKAIEQVYNALPDDYKKLVRLRYWGQDNLTWDGIAEKLYVSKRQAMRWRDEIIYATIELLGWR